MKKAGLIITICLIFLVISCTTIDPQVTGKRIRLDPAEEDYNTGVYMYRDYDSYMPYYHYPYFSYVPSFWFGLGWWNPFFYYGMYDYYYGFYPGYYWGRGLGYGGFGYPYYDYRTGRPYVTKKALQKGSKRNIPRSTVKRTTSSKGSTASRGRIRSSGGTTRTRSTPTRGRTGSVSKTRVKKKK